MLSVGAIELKKTIGVAPTSESIDGTVEPSNSQVERLSTRAKEYINDLEENEDEAKVHRNQILREFRSLCQSHSINEDQISNWSHLKDLVQNDKFFAEAMNNYAKWALSQEEDDKPMSVYSLGQTQAAVIELIENNSDGDNLFKKKSRSVLEEDPHTAEAIIGARSIANGN